MTLPIKSVKSMTFDEGLSYKEAGNGFFKQAKYADALKQYNYALTHLVGLDNSLLAGLNRDEHAKKPALTDEEKSAIGQVRLLFVCSFASFSVSTKYLCSSRYSIANSFLARCIFNLLLCAQLSPCIFTSRRIAAH